MLNGKQKLSVDELLADPGRGRGLPRSARNDLVVRLSALIMTLMSIEDPAESVELAPQKAVPKIEPGDRWLPPEEAAVRVHRHRRWIYRHADELPFVKRISRKSLLCSDQGIDRWLADKTAKLL